MKILVINAGSSSLKYQLFDMDSGEVTAKGLCERIGVDGRVTHKRPGKENYVLEKALPDHETALSTVLSLITDKELGVIKDISEIDAVGHRIAHGGEKLRSSSLIGEKELEYLHSIAEINPLHGPPAIKGIEACRKILPDIPQVGVFDTAFYGTLPEYAYIYPLPYEYYEKYKVRRYGFHGTSHRFVSQEAAKYLGREGDKDFKVVTMHLGNGSSISAVKGGKSVDTSMSFTPLGGVPMGTRSGDLDPAIVEFLANKYNMTLAETLNYLNKKSGVKGLSGVSSDFRDLTEAANAGNHRAALALDVFCYSCKKYLGAYAAAMGGVDCVVFTAGIGEHDGEVRKAIASDMEFMGIAIDKEKNDHLGDGICDITAEGGKVKVLVIPTNEELVIARDTERLAK